METLIKVIDEYQAQIAELKAELSKAKEDRNNYRRWWMDAECKDVPSAPSDGEGEDCGNCKSCQ